MNDPLTLSAGQQVLLARIQSSTPTRYRLKTQAGGVYVFCAYDALLYTLLKRQAVTLEAQPPVGGGLTVALTPEGPERLDLWHSFTHPDAPLPKVTGMPSNRCPYLHLFEEPRGRRRVAQRLTGSTRQGRFRSSARDRLATRSM